MRYSQEIMDAVKKALYDLTPYSINGGLFLSRELAPYISKEMKVHVTTKVVARYLMHLEKQGLVEKVIYQASQEIYRWRLTDG